MISCACGGGAGGGGGGGAGGGGDYTKGCVSVCMLAVCGAKLKGRLTFA